MNKFSTDIKIGIDSIGFSTSKYFMDLKTLAKNRNVNLEKYYSGIGQKFISVFPHNEDTITIGFDAANKILTKYNSTDNIKLLLFATETGIDQSKSGAVYLHKFLNLSSDCRVIELKHACYAATAALNFAKNFVLANPEQKALVVASDIAKYEMHSVGEPTQGGGAVAFLISQNPRIAVIEPFSGVYTNEVMDFWRPNFKKEPIVFGQLSAQCYISALKKCTESYFKSSSLTIKDIDLYCYHSPFPKMVYKAHERVFENSESTCRQFLDDSLCYSKIIGNSYTASLYISLCSLLENANANFANKRVGLFSYGSGSIGEFFSIVLKDGYSNFLLKNQHDFLLSNRQEVDFETYCNFHKDEIIDGDIEQFCTVSNLTLKMIKNGARVYEFIK